MLQEVCLVQEKKLKEKKVEGKEQFFNGAILRVQKNKLKIKYKDKVK